MPGELIERMAACGDCRTLAVDYGMNLIASRRPGAKPRDWDSCLTTSQIRLKKHLLQAHPVWLPGRQPDCDSCAAWSESYVVGPADEGEAWHLAGHLCEELGEVVCAPGNHDLNILM